MTRGWRTSSASWASWRTQPWEPGVSDASHCVPRNFYGPVISDPNTFYQVDCAYIDPNDIHHLNDQGRNYFLSRNPYKLISYAVFGEAYYNIADNLKVTAGLRWTVDRKQAPQRPPQPPSHWHPQPEILQKQNKKVTITEYKKC